MYLAFRRPDGYPIACPLPVPGGKADIIALGYEKHFTRLFGEYFIGRAYVWALWDVHEFYRGKHVCVYPDEMTFLRAAFLDMLKYKLGTGR